MIKEFYEKFINMVIIVSLVLAVVVCVDYADTNISNHFNDTGNVTVNDTNKVFLLNESESTIHVKNTDKIHTKTEKNKLPTISMWAKPSVYSSYSYTWYKFTWVDYCPNCGHYHCLLKNPKGVPENEYTCRYCDSDFCAVTGKEKYSWSHTYLRRA